MPDTPPLSGLGAVTVGESTNTATTDDRPVHVASGGGRSGGATRPTSPYATMRPSPAGPTVTLSTAPTAAFVAMPVSTSTIAMPVACATATFFALGTGAMSLTVPGRVTGLPITLCVAVSMTCSEVPPATTNRSPPTET